MDIRKITDSYFVAPQLQPEEFPDLAQAGITTIICNRPDMEVPPSHHAGQMRLAAEAAGLAFHDLPLTHQSLNPENVARHRDLIENSAGTVLAYCASGTRSTIVWALGQADRMNADDIIAAARAGGYDLDNVRPTLDAIAGNSTS